MLTADHGRSVLRSWAIGAIVAGTTLGSAEAAWATRGPGGSTGGQGAPSKVAPARASARRSAAGPRAPTSGLTAVIGPEGGPGCAQRSAEARVHPEVRDHGSKAGIDQSGITALDPSGQWSFWNAIARTNAIEVHLRANRIPTTATEVTIVTSVGSANVSVPAFAGRASCPVTPAATAAPRTPADATTTSPAVVKDATVTVPSGEALPSTGTDMAWEVYAGIAATLLGSVLWGADTQFGRLRRHRRRGLRHRLCPA